MTAGATVTPSSPSATALIWTSKPWRRAWRGSRRRGRSSIKSLRNQVAKAPVENNEFSLPFHIAYLILMRGNQTLSA